VGNEDDELPAKPLFRDAAVRAQLDAGMGSILLQPPFSTRALLAGSIALAFGVALFVATAEYSRRITFEGMVVRAPATSASLSLVPSITSGSAAKAEQVQDILDSSELAVSLAVPSSDARWFRPGRSVELRFPSRPDIPLPLQGAVASVSAPPLLKTGQSVQSGASEPTWRVEVVTHRVNNGQGWLLPGDKAEGAIVLPPQRVLDWVVKRDTSEDQR
jgi:hypothetical protein